ncbi:MAG: hypothetical protein OXU61_07245 [Gammaproteobacteria bacterium]|nr:hypothetical protein [Gammaproteobacteria bacterium]
MPRTTRGFDFRSCLQPLRLRPPHVCDHVFEPTGANGPRSRNRGRISATEETMGASACRRDGKDGGEGGWWWGGAPPRPETRKIRKPRCQLPPARRTRLKSLYIRNLRPLSVFSRYLFQYSRRSIPSAIPLRYCFVPTYRPVWDRGHTVL